jgi:hypothetical protein
LHVPACLTRASTGKPRGSAPGRGLPHELNRYLDTVLERVDALQQPAALACLTLVPYLQHFTGGNMRTSRLLAAPC